LVDDAESHPWLLEKQNPALGGAVVWFWGMSDWKKTQYPNRDYSHGAKPPTSDEGDDWKIVGGAFFIVLGLIGSVVLLVASLFF